MEIVVQQALGQLIALLAFFAFPASQYLLLRRFARHEGHPELWYLPAYGFRLVLRNIPRRKTLTDIRHRALVRTHVPSSYGASAATLSDEELLRREDFFLFPGTDQVLLSFKLERRNGTLVLVHTNKLGAVQRELTLSDRDGLICDYSATIQNPFNFDIEIRKRIELSARSLWRISGEIERDTAERRFAVDRVREVG